MPFEVYSKLYDTLVWPVISYGAAVWGERSLRLYKIEVLFGRWYTF